MGLLERIINASSNRNDIILDAFCGCGTALVAAQNLIYGIPGTERPNGA